MQISLFPQDLDEIKDETPSLEDLAKQAAIDTENIRAFTPLIAKFCAVFKLMLTPVDVHKVGIVGTSIVVDLAFMRIHNTSIDTVDSIHSSAFEKRLFQALWPGERFPKWFFDVFKPFKFEPL